MEPKRSLDVELLFLILQFLDEEKFEDTLHMLEKESRCYFNMKYFGDAVENGKWDEVEKYLSGFTNVSDNPYSTKMFFEIRKQRYLEALDKPDHDRALEILRKDLTVFSTFNDDIVNELTLLLRLPNFREHNQLSTYRDTNTGRSSVLGELKLLIQGNPLFHNKLQFPSLKNSRLRTLINHSLNWQHKLCNNPKSNPDIKTIFVDHTCEEPKDAQTPSPVTNQFTGSMPIVGGLPPLIADGPFEPVPASITTSSGDWMASPFTMPRRGISGGTIGLTSPNNGDAEHVLKRRRSSGLLDNTSQVNSRPSKILPIRPPLASGLSGCFPSQSHPHTSYSSDDLPIAVLSSLNQGSAANVAVSGNAVKSPIIGADGASGLSAATNIGLAERGPPGTANVPLNGEGRTLSGVKSRITDHMEKSNTLKLEKMNEQAQLRSLTLPDNSLQSGKIARLTYTNSGGSILALASNAVHKLWEWQTYEKNPGGKATTSVPPQLRQPSSGISMTNDVPETILKRVVPCFALSKNDWYVVSASGGKVSLFNMKTFKTITTFMPPHSAASFLAFHPQDNNIIAIGMEDSSVQMYNIRADEVLKNLKGHQTRVTGLAFSTVLNVLISSGADSQICVWSMVGWKMQASKFVYTGERKPNGLTHVYSTTYVQFHQDQTHVLIVHGSHIAIYKAPKLELIKQWFPRDSSLSISDATYSGDSQLIYAAFDDGSIRVFTAAGLGLRCWISSTAYLPTTSKAYPHVIAANPKDPNQFAVGLSDGDVHIIEPLVSKGEWGSMPPLKTGAGPNINPVNADSEKLPQS